MSGQHDGGSPEIYFSEEESELSEVEEYKENTPTHRKRAEHIARSNGGPIYSIVFESLCQNSETTNVSTDDVIEVILNCCGASLSLFRPDEIEGEAPSTIIDNLCNRAECEGISISHISPLQASLVRDLGKLRIQQLNELHKQNRIYENHGLARLNDDAQQASSFAAFVKSHDKLDKDNMDLYKLCLTQKFKKYDSLRHHVGDFIVKYFQTVHYSDLIAKCLPFFQEWLLAMTESKIRPVRYVGTFIVTRLGVSVSKKLDQLRRDLLICEEQYGTDKTTDRKRIGQIRDILKTINHLIRFLQDLIIPVLRNRANDISWLIQYEAIEGMTYIVQSLPLQMILGNDRTYIDDFWKVACQHNVTDLRLLALQSVHIIFDSLLETLKFSTKQDQAFNFTVSKNVSVSDKNIPALYQKIVTRVPEIKDYNDRLGQVLETFFVLVVKHVQDPDIRVALTAADRLSVMANYDQVCGQLYDVTLSDAVVTPAVSLLIHCDCPLVRHEVAKFVNKAVFTHNIVNEAAVRALLAGEEDITDKSRVMERSLELRTFVSFIKDYATGPAWQSRHLHTIRAFWPLAPILHHWDLLIDHLNIAFGAKSMTNIDGNGLGDIMGDSMWVDEGSSSALLILVLAILECQRTVLCGRERYSHPPKFQPYDEELVSKMDAERVLAELTQGGFRLAGGQDDALWDFAQAGMENRAFLRRLARNLMAMWKCLSQIISSCRAHAKNLLMALSIAYELVDATTGLCSHLAVVRSDLNFSDLITMSRNLGEICQNIARSHRDRTVLKSTFAILRKLRSQSRQVGDLQFGIADNPLEQFIKYLKEQQKNIDDFFGVMKKNSMELISGQVRELMMDTPDDINFVREGMTALRNHLNLLATLAENDNTNTFRHGLDCLDDLVNLVERKQLCLKNEESALEPTNLLTILVFDVLWIALAQWLEQIDERFGTFILHDIRAFVGDPICEADAMDAVKGAKMEERLRLFKEDLEIFKEFQNQILTFAAGCCGGFRTRALLDAVPILDCQRKSDLICAMACVSIIINTSHFHTTAALWLKIEREMLRVLRSSMRVTLSGETVEAIESIVNLTHECKTPSSAESAHEVAVFADDLRLMARLHRAHTGLENDFPLPCLTLGLWHINDETPDSLPATYQPFNLIQLFKSAQSEEASDAMCQSLPSLPELAYTFHVLLMASVCQLADVDFWRNGLLGPVVLHGLSSKSYVSQALGVAFLKRLQSYEKARIAEIASLARQMDDEHELIDAAVQPMILCELLLATIGAAVYNQARPGNTEKICERASMVLYPDYFVGLSDRLFQAFIRTVIEIVEPGRSMDGHSVFLNAISKSLLRDKIKRRWRRHVCQASATHSCELATQILNRLQGSPKQVKVVEGALRHFIAVCHPGCKIPKLIDIAPSPSGLRRHQKKRKKDSDAEITSSDTTENEEVVTSDSPSALSSE